MQKSLVLLGFALGCLFSTTSRAADFDAAKGYVEGEIVRLPKTLGCPGSQTLPEGECRFVWAEIPFYVTLPRVGEGLYPGVEKAVAQVPIPYEQKIASEESRTKLAHRVNPDGSLTPLQVPKTQRELKEDAKDLASARAKKRRGQYKQNWIQPLPQGISGNIFGVPKPGQELGAPGTEYETRFLAAGSIVSLVEPLGTGGDIWAYVKVVETHDTLSKNMMESDRERYVKKGAIGRVGARNLRKATQFTYVVKEDARVLSAGYKVPAVEDEFLKLVYDSSRDRYAALNCEDEEDVRYIFENQHGKARLLDFSCHVRAMTQDNVSAWKLVNSKLDEDAKVSLEDFNFSPHGFIEVPMESEKKHNDNITAIARGAEGEFVHYQGTDKLGVDAWGNPETVCSFLELAQRFYKRCKVAFPSHNCKIKFGDVAFIQGDGKNRGTSMNYPEKTKCPLGHSSHWEGTCIDVRPFRTDDLLRETDYRYSDENYNQAVTLLLVDTIRQMSSREDAKLIYFNDPAIIRRGMSRYMGGHADHLHFCFNDPISSCKRGE